MNSRQRRQDRKRWRYSIVTVAQDWDHYNEMWQWLNVKHGRKVTQCGWRDRHDMYDNDTNFEVRWEFDNERNATEFALRWA